MVRILIPLIAIIVIWILFFSSFTKWVRVIMSVSVLSLLVLALWLDMDSRALHSDAVPIAMVENCGVKGEFSYRSNYNLDICLHNTAETGLVKRLDVQFDAVTCDAGDCDLLQSRLETINIELAPGQKITHRENLEFEKVPPETQGILWTAELVKVWAVR